jgi:hypothetical protein
MPVYVRAADSDTWHWCFNCSVYPSNPAQTLALFQSHRPRRDLCNECRRKERVEQHGRGSVPAEVPAGFKASA